jgi:hypothetical protein
MSSGTLRVFGSSTWRSFLKSLEPSEVIRRQTGG